MSQERIEIKIKPKHFKNAVDFGDDEQCPLALAIRDHFKFAVAGHSDYISVLYTTVRIRQNGIFKKYKIEGEWQDYTPGLREGNNLTVSDLIKRAKQKKKVGTYLVTLTKIK